MHSPTPLPPNAAPLDEDLAEQARPGHGIPSQDPNPAAQTAIEPEEAKREAESALTGGGAVGGAAIGVAIGAPLAGPLGVVGGEAEGGVAGAVGGAAAGTMMSPDEPSVTDPVSGDAAPPHGGDDATDGSVKP